MSVSPPSEMYRLGALRLPQPGEEGSKGAAKACAGRREPMPLKIKYMPFRLGRGRGLSLWRPAVAVIHRSRRFSAMLIVLIRVY